MVKTVEDHLHHREVTESLWRGGGMALKKKVNPSELTKALAEEWEKPRRSISGEPGKHLRINGKASRSHGLVEGGEL